MSDRDKSSMEVSFPAIDELYYRSLLSFTDDINGFMPLWLWELLFFLLLVAWCEPFLLDELRLSEGRLLLNLLPWSRWLIITLDLGRGLEYYYLNLLVTQPISSSIFLSRNSILELLSVSSESDSRGLDFLFLWIGPALDSSSILAFTGWILKRSFTGF